MKKFYKHQKLKRARKILSDPSGPHPPRIPESGGLDDLYQEISNLDKKILEKTCPGFEPNSTSFLTCAEKISKGDVLEKALHAQKEKMKKVEESIQEIMDKSDYENMAALQRMLMEVANSGPCHRSEDKLEIVQCVGADGLAYGADTGKISYLMDSASEIVAVLGKREKGLPHKDPGAVGLELSKLCKKQLKGGGGSLSSFAPRTCREAMIYKAEVSKPSYKDFYKEREDNYYVQYDRYGNVTGAKRRPSTGSYIFAGVAQGAYSMLSFMPTYMQNNAEMDYNYQMGLQQKSYNYMMDNQWKYQYPQALPIGYDAYSGYPSGYDPTLSMDFNLGNPMVGNSGYYAGV